MKHFISYISILAYLSAYDSVALDIKSMASTKNRSEDFLDISKPVIMIGIMVQFLKEEVDNPKTSGDGHFLSKNLENYNVFYESNIERCDGFFVDRPPHNQKYFESQFEAVKNYYYSASNGNLSISSTVIENPHSENGYYDVANEMEYYAKSDLLLGELFSESIGLAKIDIENYLENEFIESLDNILFVVFHAGLGQDFTYPGFDPTIYDIKSAYIDDLMLDGVTKTIINGYSINKGLLLPETQNIIYYDVVEDIFGNPNSGTLDLCEIQIGMTGIFSFLFGYSIGLPAMFNTENGDPGIGCFGLMDYGSNNGRGVLPVFPNPWSRIKSGWTSNVIELNSNNNSDTIFIEPYNLVNKVFKVKITEDEYFLIENRNNWLLDNIDIDSLRRLNRINDQKLGHWFDVVLDPDGELINNGLVEINEIGVITKFKNYDYGLPGSGILIWHINEPNEELYYLGINNDKYNRHIHLEEADGALDIGFTSYAFFASDDPTKGTEWDMWYKGNGHYEYSNRDPNSFGTPAVVFNNLSKPNSQTVSGAESFITIKLETEINDTMGIILYYKGSAQDGEYLSIENLSNDPIKYLGNSYDSTEKSFIYFEKDNNIYRKFKNINEEPLEELTNHIFKEGWVIKSFGNDFVKYEEDGFWIDEFSSDSSINREPILPMGYINDITSPNTTQLDLISDYVAFGDIDLDGFDEVVIVDENGIDVLNENSVSTDGFPLRGNFSGIPLIANLIDVNNNKPEIICRSGNNILIISNKGEIIRELASSGSNSPLVLIPYWGEKMALLDGSRLLLFPLDIDNAFWLNPNSRPSGYPLSTGLHVIKETFTKELAYNYPNPIENGYTTFRFYLDRNTSIVKILIYDAVGYLVKNDLMLENPKINEFNEVLWSNINLKPGYYLAEVKPDYGTSQLIKLVIIN